MEPDVSHAALAAMIPLVQAPELVGRRADLVPHAHALLAHSAHPVHRDRTIDALAERDTDPQDRLTPGDLVRRGADRAAAIEDAEPRPSDGGAVAERRTR
ncbi:hypothetical protein ACIQ6K_26395 [Streptomyces sp. NPDC096354]|uniref:hypothetical protein n=1 Tax=Streptomyces sp. NPDC096354 TaxID=3366088 RepID=UPI0037F4D015